MPNYKPQYRVTIDMNGVIFPFKHITDKLIHIYFTASAGATRSAEDAQTGVDYLVPANRVAFIVDWVLIPMNQATDKIGYSETADSQTGITNFMSYPPTPLATDPIIWKIPANNYINIFDVSASAYDFWVWETDA